MEVLTSPLFCITLTVVAYAIGQIAYERTKWVLFNPIVIAMLLIMSVLYGIDMDYDTYHAHSQLIDLLLQPAIVCLAIPLYRQMKRIRQQWGIILLSSFVGAVSGIVSVVLVAWAMGAPRAIILSLVPKSVTTPIAMEISRVVGGIPALTACIVIFAGIFGSALGYLFMHRFRIHNPMAQGFSIGMAAHVLGASKSMEISANYAAFATVGLIINGICTAVIAPYIVLLLEKLLHF
ncbi:LrgB family protein [Zhouia sp. PK063]|uniref:LrgB family protein n=1 Tax=Zhouia sp. PK063 TaxID=3373602 RepID=UPI0037A3E903